MENENIANRLHREKNRYNARMKIYFPKISTWTHSIDRKRLARVIPLLIFALILIFILASYPLRDENRAHKTFWLIDASLSMNAEEKV